MSTDGPVCPQVTCGPALPADFLCLFSSFALVLPAWTQELLRAGMMLPGLVPYSALQHRQVMKGPAQPLAHGEHLTFCC